MKSACSLANVDGKEVAGIGFAATCSLGALYALFITLPSEIEDAFYYFLDIYY